MTKTKHKRIHYGTCINKSTGTYHVAYDNDLGQYTFAVPFGTEDDAKQFASLLNEYSQQLAEATK